MAGTVAAPAGPYLRRVIVTLGPLEEWRGMSSGHAIRFEGDGTTDSLRVSGSFHKTIMGMPNPSAISIHNLARDTRDAIRGGMTKITVAAGRQNAALHTVFQGSVLSAVSERSGADIVTRISAIPGHGALTKGVSSRTFREGTPLREVVRVLASDLPGITVSGTGIEGIPGALHKGGWTFAGKTKDALTQLASEYGFSWHIDDGAFRAVGDKAVFGGTVTLSGGGGGLISVTPSLCGAMQTVTGVKIKAVYAPGMAAGSSVRVHSAVSPKLNGTYRVHTVNISLDSHGEAWTMDIDSLTAPGA